MNRFNANFNDMTFVTEEGTIVDKNQADYIRMLQEKDITIEERLNIGDIVKLKKMDDFICIQKVNFEISNVGIVDYAGTKENSDDDNLILFNQKDIEKKVTQEKGIKK